MRTYIKRNNYNRKETFNEIQFYEWKCYETFTFFKIVSRNLRPQMSGAVKFLPDVFKETSIRNVVLCLEVN